MTKRNMITQFLLSAACLMLSSCVSSREDHQSHFYIGPDGKRFQVSVKFNTNKAKASRLSPIIKKGVERGYSRWAARLSGRNEQEIILDLYVGEHTRLSKTLLTIKVSRNGGLLFENYLRINTSDLNEPMLIDKIADLTADTLSSLE